MVGRPRYFQIGFMKCGTTSIAAFFNRNGIPCVHYDQGRLGRTMQRNQLRGIPLLTGYDDRYQAFTNMEYFTARDDFAGYKLYPEIMQARLYAKFRGSNGCHHVGTPPLMAGVGGFFTIRCQR